MTPVMLMSTTPDIHRLRRIVLIRGLLLLMCNLYLHLKLVRRMDATVVA